jgi:hypothetical protein
MVNNNEKDKNKNHTENHTENKKSKITKMNVNLNKNVIIGNGNGNDSQEKINNEKSNTKNQKNIKETDKESTITFIVVERNGDLKENKIKNTMVCMEELCRKCKFKKTDGYIKRTEWEYFSTSTKSTSSDSKIIIELWAKDDGLANYENKYEFPPPVDNDLFFGACALIARDNKNNYINLTKETWNKIYEFLFGGFESLVANEDSDDEEEDELDSIPSNKKTRDGYLKDGFVVDNVGVTGDSEGEDSDTDSDDTDSNSSEADNENEDKQSFSEGEGEGVYSNKKNKNALHINKMSVKNVVNVKTYGSKHIIKDDDDENAGWNTDESSELSEDEYSYS